MKNFLIDSLDIAGSLVINGIGCVLITLYFVNQANSLMAYFAMYGAIFCAVHYIGFRITKAIAVSNGLKVAIIEKLDKEKDL